MQAIKKTALAQKYHNELHCNEVMLLPLLHRFDEYRARVL